MQREGPAIRDSILWIGQSMCKPSIIYTLQSILVFWRKEPLGPGKGCIQVTLKWRTSILRNSNQDTKPWTSC